MKAAYFLIGCALTSRLLAGPFVNLDFESVNESAVAGQIGPRGYLQGSGPVKDLLPGWAADPNGRVPFNNLTDFCFGPTCWSIDSRDAFPAAAAYVLGLMTGNYAFVFDVGGGGGYSLKLSQRGDVPVGATALDLDISLPGARAEVRLDGTLVYENQPFGPLRIHDMSAFAGKTVDLEIRFLQSVTPGASGGALDRVRFVMGPSDMGFRILKTPFLNDPPQQLSLRFTPLLGRDYFVEFSDSLDPNSSWQVLPGAPHNGGTVTDYAAKRQRFYRVRSVVSSP